MASQFPTLADHMNTQSLTSTLHGATVQTEGSEFINTGHDTTKITVQNFIIDRRTVGSPDSEQTPGGNMSGGAKVQDNEDLHPVSDPVDNFGIYSVLSTALATILGRRRIQPTLVVDDSTCSDGSNLLPPEVSTDCSPSHHLEPAATVSDIAACESFSFSSLPSIITERYTRSMLNCQCTAGYPLYEPRPDCDPSAEYWKKGVRIGDVGIVTEDGIFDFIFNVCPSQNPFINPSELPDDFEALEYPEIRVMERHFKLQTHLFNNAVNRIEEPDVRYKCSGPEGAILEVPAGATLFEAKNKLSFKNLASRHAEKWYKYTIVTRGRDVPNGSLYLVTSCIKCTHWGIAVFDRPSASQDYLQFIENEVLATTNRDLRSKYDWKGLGSFIAKVAIDIPDSTGDDGTNQCIFLRGYKIMLRKDVWDNAIDPHSTGTSYITTSSSSPKPESKRERQGDLSNQDDHLRREDGDGSESAGGTSRRAAQNAYGMEPMDVDTLLTAPSQMGAERVIIQADFNASPLHPSDLVNAALLRQEPDAKIALTHDDDWWDLLRDYEDLGKIASSYASVIDEYALP
ncbi:hypothetical protein JOM56_004693 [Amanita muscaria]